MPSLPTLWLLKAPPRLMPRPLVDPWLPAAQDIPAAFANRILDPYHFGTETRQPFGGAGTGKDAGEITDAERRQRVGHTIPRGLLAPSLSDVR